VAKYKNLEGLKNTLMLNTFSFLKKILFYHFSFVRVKKLINTTRLARTHVGLNSYTQKRYEKKTRVVNKAFDQIKMGCFLIFSLCF